MKRIALLPLLFTAIALLAGCDSNNPDANAGVYSMRLAFSMDDAVLNSRKDVASVQYDVPGINPSVVDNGTVLVYFREQGTWTAMPYTFGVESSDVPAVDHTITLGYGYDDGYLEVFYEASTGAIDLLQQPDRELKVVIIEDVGFGKNGGPDLRDYEQVKAYYGLKD